jgi:hypothetical protein
LSNIAVPQASDGYWYVLFTSTNASTSTSCTTSWWWWH